jgi:IS4 transposase
VHTLLDLQGSIPTFVQITDGTVHDVNLLDQLLPEPGSIYVMDRGYLDFLRLHVFTQFQASFVIRAKKNVRFQRRYSHPADRSTGVLCDQTILLTVPHSAAGYPEPLRRIRYKDPESGKTLVFLSNNFVLPALTITELYRCRWQVEIFFKWIKQHLRIKVFYGTSENAVKTQIWTAISTYALVAILKKRLGIEHSLYTILQILSVTAFEKTPVEQALSAAGYTSTDGDTSNQLQLFDF